ncbi:MAG: c-type cytochrome [Pseudomonadota bacterium]
MKQNVVVPALLLLAGLTGMPAHADLALAKARNCMSCHSVDRKVVGPAYKDVAAKYAGQDATDQLAKKIREGGKDVWGPVPMPANTQVSPAEAKKLAAWILGLK